MCTRTSLGPVPEFQLFPGEVGEPEEGVAEQGRERESDRDSAAESSQGSDTSEGPARLGEKEDALGDLFFLGEKWAPLDPFKPLFEMQTLTCFVSSWFRRAQTSISVTSDLSTRSSASLNEEQFEDYGEGEEPDYAASSPSPDDETRTNGCSDLGSSVPSRWELKKINIISSISVL